MKKQKTVEHGKYGLIFTIPFFLVFAVFQLYPLLYTFYSSLIYEAKNGRNVIKETGLGNFKNYVFGEMGGGEIWKALAITAVLWILNFIPQILLSLVLAAWFTDVKYKLKGTGAFKVIMYMPTFRGSAGNNRNDEQSAIIANYFDELDNKLSDNQIFLTNSVFIWNGDEFDLAINISFCLKGKGIC